MSHGSHGVLVPSYRQRIGYHATLLAAMALFASTALVIGDMLTGADIAQRRAEDLLASLSQVLPAEGHDNDLLASSLQLTDDNGKPLTVYQAQLDGKVTGVAYQMTGPGYAGDILVLMGVDAKGTILGVRVLAHAETPGLGDKIEVERDPWITSFDGRSLGNPDDAGWAVKKDGGIFDQFTGATITPRGVVKAVRKGLDFFARHQGELTTAVIPELPDVPSDAPTTSPGGQHNRVLPGSEPSGEVKTLSAPNSGGQHSRVLPAARPTDQE